MFGNYQMPKKELTSLHLHFTSNALAYGVYDSRHNFYTQFSTHTNLISQVDWDSAFSNDPLLRLSYLECKASFTNELFTLIPHHLFEPQDIENYLNFNIHEPESYFKASKPVIQLEAEVIFCVQRDSKIILSKYFPNSQIYHSSVPLLEGLLRPVENTRKNQLHIYMWNNMDMEIVVIQNGKLSLYNYFFINSPEEFLYFPLYISEQLKLERPHLELFLGGNSQFYAQESETLKAYFPNFYRVGLPGSFQYASEVQSKQNLGMIGSLAFLGLCE